MGRAAQASPVKVYHNLTPQKKPWRAHGYASLVGNTLLMMFYTSVTGWMLQYFIYMLTGKFEGMTTSTQVSAVFGEMLSQPWVLIAFVAVVVIVGFFVCSFNMQKGLEKVTKYMMLALLGLILVLAEGLKFYLLPSLDKVSEVGLLTVIVEAMNQAFFTLSLGIGAMAIFGSFIGKERSLLGESVNIAVLDTFVAISAGLIIFPAFFTYMGSEDIGATAGPALIFQTLPNIFVNMAGGRIWGSLFFLFMSFAALSTIFAVFQNILSCVQEMTGWSKKKACVICGAALFVLSIPCVLGFNAWASFEPLGKGSGVLDLEDYIVSNILLPLGSLVVVLFCNHKFGWGFKKFQAEANEGRGLKVKNWMRIYFAYVLPIIISVILVYGIISPFI